MHNSNPAISTPRISASRIYVANEKGKLRAARVDVMSWRHVTAARQLHRRGSARIPPCPQIFFTRPKMMHFLDSCMLFS